MKKILLSLTLAILLLPSFVLAANSQADCAANETFYPDIAGSGGVCQRNQATNPNTTNPNPNSICNGKTCTYTPLEPIPGLPQSGNDFAGFLNGMFKLLFTIGGMIAVASLVYGGITYMVSEIVGKIEWAKRQMRAALWGLALLVAAWLILYTINPDLITFKLNVQSITTNTPTPAASNTQTPYIIPTVAEEKNKLKRDQVAISASSPAKLASQYNAQNCAEIRASDARTSQEINRIRMGITARQAAQPPYSDQLLALGVGTRDNSYKIDQCQSFGN